MIPSELFRQICGLLEDLEIPYVLTGCCASNYYGAPRGTPDIDFLIAANAAVTREFLQGLPANEYLFDLPSSIEAAQAPSLLTLIHEPSGWKIDLVFQRACAFDDERLRRRVQMRIEGMPLFIETPEDLLLSQLQWTKEGKSLRQIEDAAGIVKVSGDQLDFEYIEQWIANLRLKAEWAAVRKLAVLPGSSFQIAL